MTHRTYRIHANGRQGRARLYALVLGCVLLVAPLANADPVMLCTPRMTAPLSLMCWVDSLNRSGKGALCSFVTSAARESRERLP